MTIITQTQRSFPRGLARTALCVLGILLAAAAVNLVGIWLIGDVKGWSGWLHEHTKHFAVWRGILYATTTFGWWWMRGRVLRRESNRETRTRLLRTEIGAVLAVAVLEITMLLQTR
jgi:hypothetical protein